jgi:hypothetical protein
MRLPRKIWKRHHYSVPRAGRLANLSRSASYRAAHSGFFGPLVKDGGFFWVPKKPWDRRLMRLRRKSRRSLRKSTTRMAEAKPEAGHG